MNKDEQSYVVVPVVFKFEKEYACEPGQTDGLAILSNAGTELKSDFNGMLKLSTNLI